MAKYERRLKGNFDEFLRELNDGILRGSMSASLEDGSDYSNQNVRCAVRVYERYSMTGGNRLSMNITLVGDGDDLFVSVITAGGSQAMLFKFNTIGEESFLQCAVQIIESHI